MDQLIFLLGFLALFLAFLFTLNNTLLVIKPKNRHTQPSSVWLMLIPLYNLVWQFILYRRLINSITAEYKARGYHETAEQSYRIGVTSAIVLITSSFASRSESIPPLIETLLTLTGLVTWGIFWIQISNHRNRIKSLPPDSDSVIFNNV
jgi:hypothetical protein